MVPSPAAVRALLLLAAVAASYGCNTPDSSGLYSLRPARESVPAQPAEPSAGPNAGAAEQPAAPLGGAPAPTPESPTGETPIVTAGEQLPLGGGALDAGAEEQFPPPPEPVDAGAQSPAADAAVVVPVCAGQPLRGSCWYLGDDAESCAGACAAHGGFSEASLAVIGTPDQGGSIQGCAAVLQALGAVSSAVQEGVRTDGLGFGCHIFVDAAGALTDAWWLTSPALAPEASGIAVRRACGCVR